MRVLAIHATKNTTKPDATGAFIPEAKAFQTYWTSQGAACARFGFDNKAPEDARRESVATILSTQRDLDLVAIFCHGFRHRLDTGHNIATVGRLADAIARASKPRVAVMLYACSTAGTRSRKLGGFADALRDSLTARGVTGHVDGHTVAGHTVWVPFVQRFDMGDDMAEIVGEWVVPTKGPAYRKWRDRLRADGDTLCYRFPVMTADAIRAELAT